MYEFDSSDPPKKKQLGVVSISINLGNALRIFCAQAESEPLALWIDAICIHPSAHSHEKSAQIKKMAEIYTEAVRVRVWLGSDPKDEAKDAFQFIEEVLDLNDFDKICDSPVNAKRWDIFLHLMQKRWFQRRWIVQEIAFAQEATIYWGSQQLDWDALASIVQLFALKKEPLRQMFHKSSYHYNHDDYFGEIEAYGALGLVNMIDIMFRKSDTGDIMDLLLSLESILTNMTGFDASRPHDTVYAVMQLSNDAKPASKSTIAREKAVTPAEDGQFGRQIPSVTFSEAGLNRSITHSPDTLQRTHKKTEELPAGLISDSEWADELQLRGRPRYRLHSSHHLAVLGENHTKTRSRDRSPAVAKDAAEKMYKKPKRSFHVDYEKSMLSLCTEVVNFVVNQSNSIDIICKPWVPNMLSIRDQKEDIHSDDKVTLPSWIQTREKRPFGFNPDHRNPKYTRIAADPLVGKQLQGSKTYSASGIVPYPRDMNLIDGRVLNARGFVLDTVFKIGSQAVNGTIPSNWLQLGTWVDMYRRHPKPGNPPEQFWRTLVANRASSDGPKGPPLFWKDACKFAYSHKAQDGPSNLDTGELIRDLSGKIPSPVRAFAERVRAVAWNRVLIVTKGEADSPGMLGLAPLGVEAEDLVCILYGCSVPVLLRKRKHNPETRQHSTVRGRTGNKRSQYGEHVAPSRRSTAASSANEGSQQRAQHPESGAVGNGAVSSNGIASAAYQAEKGDEYYLIGECYIHGMMDGEAFSKKAKQGVKETDFRLGCAAECNCLRCDPTAFEI